MAEPTTPRPGSSAHAATIRGLAAGATPGLPFGRFGPMFDLPPCPSLPEPGLAALAQAMVKQDPGAPITEREPVDENAAIPAGYTYFGQFVDHDITFDPTPLGAAQVDPEALADFRSPALDLDSVYGRGPADQPYLYERDGLRLRLGAQVNAEALAPVNTRLDILRLPDGTAILGDKRNDENKIVSQIHGAFIAFHNKVVTDDALLDAFGADRSTPEARFAAAATILRWHYQWVVVHDFLQRICSPGMVAEVLNPGGTPRLQHYLQQEAKYPYMPLEFSGAAYRFGHSMVRPSYSLNKVVLARKEGGDPAKERIPTFSRDPRGTENLNGFPGTLPAFWGIDWSFFLDDVEGVAGGVRVGGKPAVLPQPSYRIDALLAEPLQDLPEFFNAATPPGSPASILGNLAFRNLKRGQLLRLPSGQAVAQALGIAPLPDDILWGAGSFVPPPAGDAEIRDALASTAKARRAVRRDWVDPPGAPLRSHAPLWYYVLREAEYYGASEPQRDGAAMGGQHLGPVGSRIVAETLIGLLWLDPTSFLHSRRGFRPLDAVTGGKPLTLGRMIGFALR
ncbi:peroxidase family protein [Roseicella frigidaeris]|nr:heme peroxidase family protein [Roseicella frigidaeris]